MTRARRPDGPYRDAEEFVDSFSDEAVACTRKHRPKGKGQIVVAADLSEGNKRPEVEDWGSVAGSDAAVACIKRNVADKLLTPGRTPARYARIRVPVPLKLSGVTYSFTNDVPGAAAAK